MFNSGQLLEVSHKLYALIFKAKKATLISNGTKSLQFALCCTIEVSHLRLAHVEKWVEADCHC